MNNRNPFIPNIPTPQGAWGDPQIQLYTQNTNNNQINGQVPFTAHQQVHLQPQSHSHQSMYNIGYTTAGTSLPLSSMPLQSTSGTIFWDDTPGVNLNNSSSGGMQMNYSYQNIQNLQNIQNMNSCYQQQLQQHQQIVNVNPSGVHQIVNQNPRVVPLTLDAHNFVHFPVNLSPTSGMVPLTLNSRPSAASMTQFSMGSSSSHSPLSLNSRSPDPMSPVQNNSPSPSLQREPLSLNSRSSGSSGSGGALPLTSRSLASMLPQSNTANSPSPGRMEPLSLNSRSSGNSVPLPRNSRSPASFSVSSPSPTPMAQAQQILNSRSGSSFVPLPLHSRSPSSSSNTPFSSSSSSQSLNLRSPPTSAVPFTMNSSSHSLSSRSPLPPGLTQQFTANLLSSNPRIPISLGARSPAASMIPFSSMNYASHSQSVSSYNTSQPVRSQQQAPAAHSRSSVTPVNARSPVSNISFSHNSPSPPSPPPKKKRAPRKRNPPKKTPERPLPINPTLSLPVNHSSPTSMSLNRPTVISSAMNSWPHMLPTHVSSTNNQTAVVTTVSSSWTNPTSAAASMLHMTINPFPLVPTRTLNTPPMMPLATNRLTPLTPASTNSSLVVPTAVTSSQMMIPVSSSRPSPMAPLGGSSCPPRPPMSVNSSPPKNSSLSVLDYALERAGIPSSGGQSQDEVEANTEVFREEEILQLVGEIPDQSAELQMLNPNHELRSSESKIKADKTNGSTINSWEQDTFNRPSGSRPGDDDLEFELQRFYCPPSPPKDGNKTTSAVTISTTTGTSSITATSTSTATAGSLSQTTSSSKLTLVQADQSLSGQMPKPSSASVPGAKPGKSAAVVSSDDDCEVILVKLSNKKRRVHPNQLVRRGGVPPKKMPLQTKGKEVPGYKKQEARRSGTNATTSRYITPVEQRARDALSVDPRSKAIARPAYPNGRYISVAPKTTVPIPCHQTSNIKSVPQDVTKPQTVVIKETARKSTGGIAKNNPFPTPKATARKSTAPLPKSINKTQSYLAKSADVSETENYEVITVGRGKRQCAMSTKSTPQAPPPKRSRKTAKSTHSAQDDKELRIVVNKLTSEGVDYEYSPSPEDSSRPPIKLKFSFKESTTKSSKKGRAKKSGKGKKRKGKSTKKRYSAKAKLEDDEEEDPIMEAAKASSSKTRISNSLNLESSGKRDLRKRNSSGNRTKNLESDDELLIVQEYLADSDESYDPNGERDEASSESESEPEAGAYEDDDFMFHQPDDENNSEAKAITDPIPSPPPSNNKEDEDNNFEVEAAHSASSSVKDVPVDYEPMQDEEGSPLGHDFNEDNDYAADSPSCSTATQEKVHGESTKETGDNNISEEPEGENGSDDSSDEDGEEVKRDTVPKTFEMPKPEIVLKGTKEEADKAVADMRHALAQLSKFKIPFFGK